MKNKIKRKLLVLWMISTLVASIVAPTVLVGANYVDDNFKGQASTYITDANGHDFSGQSGVLNSIVQDGYIYFRTEVNRLADYKVSGIEILEMNVLDGSDSANIDSVEYFDTGTQLWTDAMNYIVNTDHEYTNKMSIKRNYRIKIKGDISLSIQYKVYTPEGINSFASFLRYVVVQGDNSSSWFVKPDNIENVQLNVSSYGGEGQEPYPTKDGKLFAGWYTDKTYSTPYLESTGFAYAKFVDEAVLSSKHQWKNDHTALRFVSSIDSIDYDCVGFIFSGTYGDKVIEETDKSVTKVYKSIYAEEQQLSPTVISDESEYFFIYTVRNMDSSIGSSWTVTPYFVTLDGTKVLGETSTFSYTP